MSLPRKENGASFLSTYVQSVEHWLNDSLGKRSSSQVARLIGFGSLFVTLLVGLFLFTYPSTIVGVGSITTPRVLEETASPFGDKTTMEGVYELWQKQAFIDSVETLGMKRMEEIYIEKYKSHNDDRKK